jgi:hypothetical protein
MQKTQTFSCLFRHYAKHNGLRKEGWRLCAWSSAELNLMTFCTDLAFYFVNELLPDQVPDSVHLRPQGMRDYGLVIKVNHLRCGHAQMKSLLSIARRRTRMASLANKIATSS